VVPSGLLNGKALVYLPRYMPAEDQFFHKSADEIFDIFLGGLRIIFPNFSEQDIVAYCVKRETLVQPIQKINYSKNIPSMQTPMKNFFIVNTTMILNSTLNNNQVIKLARKAADLIAQS
jgi:protoporphyrinogen oxidase